MSAAPSFDYIVKFVIAGDAAVGKTTLLQRFADETYQKTCEPTKSIDFRMPIISVGGYKIKFQIWDTSGQARFRSIILPYYTGSHGFMLIFDVTNQSSFNDLSKHLDNIRQRASEAPIFLVGTKIDLFDSNGVSCRVISEAQATEFAKDKELEKYFEVNAYDKTQVKSIFSECINVFVDFGLPKSEPLVLDESDGEKIEKENVLAFAQELQGALSFGSRGSRKATAVGALITKLSSLSEESDADLLKSVLKLFLQHDRFSFFNTTTSGKKAVELLNAPEYELLRKELNHQFLMANSSIEINELDAKDLDANKAIRYRDLRCWASGKNDSRDAISFFAFSNSTSRYNEYITQPLLVETGSKPSHGSNR